MTKFFSYCCVAVLSVFFLSAAAVQAQDQYSKI